MYMYINVCVTILRKNSTSHASVRWLQITINKSKYWNCLICANFILVVLTLKKILLAQSICKNPPPPLIDDERNYDALIEFSSNQVLILPSFGLLVITAMGFIFIIYLWRGPSCHWHCLIHIHNEHNIYEPHVISSHT